MKKFRNAGAILAGLAASVVLTLVTDVALQALHTGDTYDLRTSPPAHVAAVLGYRFVYNVLGCYIAGRLSTNPIKYAMILATIGLFASIGGAAALWDTAPSYYLIGLILLALPAGWLGGRIAGRRTPA